MDVQKLKVAITYDWLDRWGGVERVLLTLHDMLPQAQFFTSVYNPQKASWAKYLDIHTSFMQKLPGFIRNSRVLSVLFYPFAFENINFNEYDLVLSVSSSFAKSVVTKPETAHLCYLLTPSRYLWLYPHPMEGKIPAYIFRRYQSYMKEWDFQAAMRPDKLISISETVANRCRQIYKRESEVIYPPFDAQYWGSLPQLKPKEIDNFTGSGEYYLVVSRIEPYKRVDLVIDTFKQRPQDKVIIVGNGTQLKNLHQQAGSNILFLNEVTEQELKWLYSHATALIMPQEEDFGYVSLEAQQFGTPVIAYNKGGAAETVVPDKTGFLFSCQSVASLSSTIERFDKISYNFRHNSQSLGHLQAMKYSKEIFIARMTEVIINSVLRSREGRIYSSL